MRLYFLAPLVLLFSVNSVTAQNFDLGSWNIINIKYDHNEKWSFFGEGQLRSLKFYDNFHYYEYKGGINFKAHKNLNIWKQL